VGKQGEGLWAKGLNSNLKQNAPQRHLLYAKFKMMKETLRGYDLAKGDSKPYCQSRIDS